MAHEPVSGRSSSGIFSPPSTLSATGLGRLRVAESGGMYTRPDIIANFREQFGIPVLSVWGSTETTGAALAARMAGAEVILLERTDMLLGTGLVGGINCPEGSTF